MHFRLFIGCYSHQILQSAVQSLYSEEYIESILKYIVRTHGYLSKIFLYKTNAELECGLSD